MIVHACLCMRVCVRTCVRACVHTCVRAYVRACLCVHAWLDHDSQCSNCCTYIGALIRSCFATKSALLKLLESNESRNSCKPIDL